MTNVPTTIQKTPAELAAEKKNGIETHKQAAKHFENAAKHHTDAANHHESGDHEKAAVSTLKAHGQQLMANDLQKETIKKHEATTTK